MEKTVEDFFFDNYDLEVDKDNICLKLVDISVTQLYDLLLSNKEKVKFISAANIPQFSNLSLISSVLRIVNEADTANIDYEYIGEKLNVSRSQSAKVKYGENHVKLAIQMGLVLKSPYRLTNLGKIYLLMKESEQEEINRKLFFRIPIVQQITIKASEEHVNAMDIMASYLARTTAIRRRGNIRKLFLEVINDLPNEKGDMIKQNVSW